MRWIGAVVGAALAWSLGAAAQQNEGVTSSEIVVGMSAPFTGASRSLGIELYRGAQAYLDEVNRLGGVNGRRITVKPLDDGYQPEVAAANTLQLMHEDKVFLLFNYVGTPTVSRVLPLLKKYEKLHMRLLAPFTGAQPQRESPYDKFAYNLRASYRQETAGLVSSFLSIGRSRIAVFYQADGYGRSGWVGVREALATQGLKMVGESTYSRGTKFTESLDRQVAILQEVNPDAIISIGAYEACAAFIRDARKAGLTVPIANVSFVGSESMLELLRRAGQIDGRDYTTDLVNSQVVPSYENQSVAVVQEYRTLMAKYNEAPPSKLWAADYEVLPTSFVGLEGFLNAKLLVEILKRLGDQPTRAQLDAAVASLQDVELGMGRPVSFAGSNQGSDAIFYTTVEDGRFVPVRSWQGWQK
ncbi:MAG: ABC transporter substrate-binding protein [Vicinamibacterales bacterium]